MATATKRILLAHGGGGQLTDELVADLIRPDLDNPVLAALDDSCILPTGIGRVAFTTDSYVVQPLEFPGGDIGRLAVSGTVNDLAVSGATPLGLSLALIIEEGLEESTLKRIIASVAATCHEAGVNIVTGDTKVVARGQADGLYINTSGVGIISPDRQLGYDRVAPGDTVIISGSIADHGLAVMLQREQGESIKSALHSDVAPLNSLIDAVFQAAGDGVAFMRDPTRGGLAGVASDLAENSGLHLTLDESCIPVRPETLYAAEMLGLDPLDVANEGKVVIVVRPDKADRVIKALHGHTLGSRAAIIGELTGERDGLCELITDVGGRRIVQKPYGEELPRIC
ncbi:MAG: hydrogenase expression/formation protein HypE [Planctomycetes bacterium]|nr:hydrogenase expression/formation protein HypE [Planctomycetota bacterium]NOG53776.1 hydrogenase expression/formation protein HypE [Planctomycetota bacterium]